MANFKQDILRRAGDEPIEAIVIQPYRESNYDHPENTYSNRPNRPVQAWQDVEAELDYEYDDGYGGEDCHAFVAWTPTRVLFLGVYDGSTWIDSVPRNPVPYAPEGIGGG